VKIITFDYKDLAGNETHRSVITIAEPRTNYLTYDVTEINEPERTTILNKLKDLENLYAKDRGDILEDHAVFKIREFKPERMSNMVSK